VNKIILSSIIAISLLLFSACSYKYTEAPLATNFKKSNQKKIQSASHWKVISKDLAKSVVEKVGLNQSVYISKTKNNMKFEKSMHKLFISALVNQGMKVSINKTSKDILINIDIETIKFTKNRAMLARNGGVLTLLTAGVWSLNGIYEASGGSAAAAAGGTITAVGVDAYNWYNSEYASGPTPQHEIIITVSAEKGNQYITNYNNIYYIADEDKKLYSNTSTTLKIKGN